MKKHSTPISHDAHEINMSVDIFLSFDKTLNADNERRMSMATRKRAPKKAVGMVVERKPKVRIGARVDQDLYMLCKMA